MSTVDQVLRGRVGFSMGGNPTVIVDTANGSIISDSIISNSTEIGDLYPLDPLLPVINVQADLVFPNNSFGLIFGTAPNESAIYATGADLFIEAPGNVVINNLDLSNVNVNVNLDGINSALNNLNSDVLNLQNEDANLSNLIGNSYNQANSAFNQANSAFNGANSALNTANSAFNGANSALNIANNAYNQANSATILAGSAYNQANSYLNSLNTNQLVLSTSELIFKANLSSSPQVSLNSNGVTLPFLSVERTFGGDVSQSILEPTGLAVSHNITSTASDEQPYFVMTDINAITQVGIYSGPNVPSFVATGGSLYLQNDGQFYTYDGANWASQALGGKITCKDILVRDNANSNTTLHLDPANLSGMVINTNGGTEDPQITIDKFNTASDSISVLGSTNLNISHAFSVEDQNVPYFSLFDSANTALINASIFFGANVPTHTSLVGNGSLFIKGGASPNFYQFNGTAWAGVGGGATPASSTRIMSRVPNTATVLPSAGGVTKITWNTLDFNSNESAYFLWDATNQQFNIQQTGIYEIDAQVGISALTNTSFAQATLYLNNLPNLTMETSQGAGGSAGVFLQLNRKYQLNANTKVDIRAQTVSEAVNRDAGINRFLSFFQLSTIA